MRARRSLRTSRHGLKSLGRWIAACRNRKAHVALGALPRAVIFRRQLILVGAAEIPTRCQQIFPCCPTWTIEGEASRRGNHWRMQSDNAPFATHSTRKIQILEKIKISKTVEFFENVSANEDSLITEKPSAQPCANAGEHACAAQKPGRRIIASGKTAPNDIPLCNYRFDLCKSILRQSCISVKKQEHVASRRPGTAIHLARALFHGGRYNTRAVLEGNRDAAIGTARVDNDNFMGAFTLFDRSESRR